MVKKIVSLLISFLLLSSFLIFPAKAEGTITLSLKDSDDGNRYSSLYSPNTLPGTDIDVETTVNCQSKIRF